MSTPTQKNTSQTETKENLLFTWERLIPKQIPSDRASQEIQDIHFRHYQIACASVNGKRVLDIACGAGYGTQMLRLAGAIAVVGSDICPETIAYANQHYQVPGVEFNCANAEQFDWPEPFDEVVSFQTLEHLRHPHQFLERIHALLRPGGFLWLSVPLGETRHIDPYHLQVFHQEQIFSLLEETGFSVELYRIDNWKLTRSDLLLWHNLYPEARPSLSDYWLTSRGWRIVYDWLFRGGIAIPQLLVKAIRCHSNQT